MKTTEGSSSFGLTVRASSTTSAVPPAPSFAPTKPAGPLCRSALRRRPSARDRGRDDADDVTQAAGHGLERSLRQLRLQLAASFLDAGDPAGRGPRRTWLEPRPGGLSVHAIDGRRRGRGGEHERGQRRYRPDCDDHLTVRIPHIPPTSALARCRRSGTSPSRASGRDRHPVLADDLALYEQFALCGHSLTKGDVVLQHRRLVLRTERHRAPRRGQSLLRVGELELGGGVVEDRRAERGRGDGRVRTRRRALSGRCVSWTPFRVRASRYRWRPEHRELIRDLELA